MDLCYARQVVPAFDSNIGERSLCSSLSATSDESLMIMHVNEAMNVDMYICGMDNRDIRAS